MNTSNSHITGRFNELIQLRGTTQRQIDGAKAVHGHIWKYPKHHYSVLDRHDDDGNPSEFTYGKQRRTT